MARERSQKDVDRKLDEALEESFPASDPVSVGHNDHPGNPAPSATDRKNRKSAAEGRPARSPGKSRKN
jgi:hypothetical protein